MMANRTRNPRVAVLMCAYNAERTLQQAVDSLYQNAVEFEVLIVDDGSQIPVLSYLQPRDNVSVHRLPFNVGLVAALNAGLDLLSQKNVEYIARMDADDLSGPHRLDMQAAHMEREPDTQLLGGWARFVDEVTLEPIGAFRPAAGGAELRKALALNTAVLHPTWFVRRQAILNFRYRDKYPTAEDYDFLMRFSRAHKIENIPDFILDYRVSSQGISVKKRRKQLFDRIKIQIEYFDFFFIWNYIGVLRTIALILTPSQIFWYLRRVAGSVRGGEG